MVMVTHKAGNILLHLDKRTKGENTVYKKIVILLLLVGVTFAQEKIGVVFSEKIRLDFEEFNEVEQQLQLDLQVIQKEYQTMAVELDSMVKEYEQQSLMMSEELKKAKEQDIVDMNNAMQSYQQAKVGPNGELTRKQAQLEFDLVQKFKSAVDAVAISKGYDIILDGSQASLYTKPTHDLTDDVLYQLRKSKE